MSRARMHVDTMAIGSLRPDRGCAHDGPWRPQQAASPDMCGDEGEQPHTKGGECEWSRRVFYSEHGGMLSRHFHRRTSSSHMLNPTPLYLSPTHVHHTPARSHSCTADPAVPERVAVRRDRGRKAPGLGLATSSEGSYLRMKGQLRCHRKPDLFLLGVGWRDGRTRWGGIRMMDAMH
jgi:hypothetical protein